jgi:hypothetical protein
MDDHHYNYITKIEFLKIGQNMEKKIPTNSFSSKFHDFFSKKGI